MVFSDGQLLFVLNKLREHMRQRNHIEESTSTAYTGVYLTNNQILGFFTLTVANLLSCLLLQNWHSNILLVAYLALSVLEHFLVETGKSHPTLAWENFSDIYAIVLNGGKTATQRDNSGDPESLTLTQ